MKLNFDKKFWVVSFTLTGTIIGAGILGLPYVFSQSGFLIGMFWVLFLGAIMIVSNLYLAEVSLRTKSKNQIPGYAEKYLGKWGKYIMIFAMAFGIYSALLAYLIGEGQSFSKLIFGNYEYSFFFALVFWTGMTLLLRKGIHGLRKIEFWGVLAILLIVFSMLLRFFHFINFNNLNYVSYENLFLPLGVVLFALMGFTSIPELRELIQGKEKRFRKAIIVGSLIPIATYIIFSFIFVGILGKNVTEVATLSFGNLVTVLGIFTMLTSYFVLSFSLRDIFYYDLKKRGLSAFFVSIVPLVLFVLAYFLDKADFINILSIGGVFSGGMMGILILLMNKISKKKGNRKPEFSIPINWSIIITLSTIFAIGMMLQLYYLIS